MHYHIGRAAPKPRPRPAPVRAGPPTPGPDRRLGRVVRLGQVRGVTVSRTGAGVAVATAAALWLTPQTAELLPPALRVGVVGAALLLGPGWLVLRAVGATAAFTAGALPAACFVASQALLATVFALLVVVGAPLPAALPCVTVCLLGLLPLDASAGSADASPLPARRTLATTLVFVLLGATLALAAFELTRTGSVDRWWYLAYIRGFLHAPALDASEPFLATGLVHPRFAFQPWLMTLALWSRQAAVDPIWLYERGAPAVVAPLALSAQLALGWALFATPRLARTSAACAVLLMLSAGPLPVPARVLEDKVLAAAIAAPVLMAVCLHHARARIPLSAPAGTGAVLAILHPLVYALALLVVVPWLALDALGGACTRRRALVLAAVVSIGALYAGTTGMRAAAHARAGGASLADRRHPVVRVHLGRERLILFDRSSATGAPTGYVVDPRLLVHPLVLLALAAVPLAWRRPPRERAYLMAATAAPLLVAFVPPLPMIVGAAVLPWMVYRVLWMVPYGALLAIGVERAAGPARRPLWACLLALACVAAVPAALNVRGRMRAERAALATPEGVGAARIGKMFGAVAALAPDSIVAAAPELAERIPAMTGRQVLAMSDRATIVFSGSRAQGEARLRARAALFAGIAHDDARVPTPSHLLLASAADEPAGAACGRVVAGGRDGEGFTLCELQPPDAPRGALGDARPDRRGAMTLALAARRVHRGAIADIACDPPQRVRAEAIQWSRPGPWSARAARARCTLRVRDATGDVRDFVASTLLVRPRTGRAVEELVLRVSASRAGAPRWSVAGIRRVGDGEPIEVSLPAGEVDEVELVIVPAFLPFLKLTALEMTVTPTDTAAAD